MQVRIGDAVHEWDGDYTLKEMSAIERVTGVSFLDWLNRMRTPTDDEAPKPFVTDQLVWLWIVAKRANPALSYDDFDCKASEWEVIPDPDDAAAAVVPDPTPTVPDSTNDESST